MPHDLMLRCEQRRRFKIDGQIELRWKEVPVSEVVAGAEGDVRCLHCHGAIRIHRQQVDHGPQDHAEHRRRADSQGCRGGHYFEGTHRISAFPVV